MFLEKAKIYLIDFFLFSFSSFPYKYKKKSEYSRFNFQRMRLEGFVISVYIETLCDFKMFIVA